MSTFVYLSFLVPLDSIGWNPVWRQFSYFLDWTPTYIYLGVTWIAAHL